MMGGKVTVYCFVLYFFSFARSVMVLVFPWVFISNISFIAYYSTCIGVKELRGFVKLPLRNVLYENSVDLSFET